MHDKKERRSANKNTYDPPIGSALTTIIIIGAIGLIGLGIYFMCSLAWHG